MREKQIRWPRTEGIKMSQKLAEMASYKGTLSQYCEQFLVHNTSE
jgi:hypothetical protein